MLWDQFSFIVLRCKPMPKTLFALITSALVVVATIAFTAQSRAAELIYFGSSACLVCERWDEEVGEIYPKTEESQILPLRHEDVHDERAADLAFIKGVVYTPTFVAVEDGKEMGRIVGYMGDFFFWEQVGSLIKKLKAVPPKG
ncbi:thioredoxin domain-containing protein [Magnetovibrio blakemorei]|nr:thioredoxin family protein [Magnetovibrio blakemorei]